jgi:hypothetical protein
LDVAVCPRPDVEESICLGFNNAEDLVEMIDQFVKPVITLPQFGLETVGVLTVLRRHRLTFCEPALGLRQLVLTVCGVHGDSFAPPAQTHSRADAGSVVLERGRAKQIRSP